MPSKVHKSIWRFGFGLSLLAAGFPAGCASAPAAAPPAKSAKPAKATADAGPRRLEPKRPGAAVAEQQKAPEDPTAGLLDPGDELAEAPARPSPAAPVDPEAPVPTTAAAAGSGATAANSPSSAGASGGQAASPAIRAAAARMAAESEAKRRTAAAERSGAGSGPGGRWSILLATSTGADARTTAMSVRDEIARRVPSLRDAFVSPTPRGYVVLAGRYPSPEDPSARKRLEEVKAVVDRGTPLFPRAMLTRTSANAELGPPGPNDLRIVRQTVPARDLFTVQVAAWSTFGSPDITMDQVRRSAEDHCRQLRSQGNEAYYFHDLDAEISTVTVGVFGNDAYDPRSTLFSPEVDEVMRRFPKHLVNGEEVLVPTDPKDPSKGGTPQAPRLVEVPRS